MDFLAQYGWIILVTLIIVAAIWILFFRPRQSVRLTDSAPTRPHMAQAPLAREGRGLAGEAAAGVADVTGAILGVPVHRKLGNDDGPADNLLLLKGVGPKLATTLQELGFHRFDQIAGLTPNEVERIDERLGSFRGRLTRDRIVEQADYLARNDIDGFEQKFGKLTS